ncbi:nucleotidyltransferase [bacterium]|nr:nucleotidyltransferase [bacterium]
MLNQDYKEMLQVLKKYEVEFIIIGAYALAAHGYPRSTMDIDIWVKCEIENSIKLFKALKEFGAPLIGVDSSTFTEEGIVYQIGVAPCRIDLFTKLSGNVSYDQAKNRAIVFEFDGVSVPILSIEDLIINKLATNRPKDIEDVEMLKKL